MLFGDEAINAMTEKIIGCAFRVRDKLMCGFLEKVYENDLATDGTDRHGRSTQFASSTEFSASLPSWVRPEIRARPPR